MRAAVVKLTKVPRGTRRRSSCFPPTSHRTSSRLSSLSPVSLCSSPETTEPPHPACGEGTQSAPDRSQPPATHARNHSMENRRARRPGSGRTPVRDYRRGRVRRTAASSGARSSASPTALCHTKNITWPPLTRSSSEPSGGPPTSAPPIPSSRQSADTEECHPARLPTGTRSKTSTCAGGDYLSMVGPPSPAFHLAHGRGTRRLLRSAPANCPQLLLEGCDGALCKRLRGVGRYSRDEKVGDTPKKVSFEKGRVGSPLSWKDRTERRRQTPK